MGLNASPVGETMTRILALDTSAEACSVALLDGEQIHQRSEIAPREHTRLILPMVDELLVAAGLDLVDLDGLAFGCGPGSFTGLRICAGVVQGLAYGAELPVVPVSSLAAVAAGASHATGDVLACFDARMGEFYFGHYRVQGSALVLQGGEQLLAPAALEKTLHQLVLADCAAVGSGWACLDQLGDLSAEAFLSLDAEACPQAAAIARLAQGPLSRGEGQSAETVEPVYLRNEVAWKKQP